jgi:hypothetical protein
MRCSPTPTVFDAIWDDQRAITRCSVCGCLHSLDLRRLALDGHGRERLCDLPFLCECGSTDHEVIAEPAPAG